MVSFSVTGGGLEVQSRRQLKSSRDRLLSQVVNDVARKQRAEAAKRIRSEINLPSRLLAPKAGQLFISKFARPGVPVAIIKASSRPRSLARFSRSLPRSKGALVQVKPGQARYMRKAFFVNLRGGARVNRLLAIRLRPGDRIRNKKKQPARSRTGLTFLHGPSVQQAFIANSGHGVARDITPETLVMLEREYLRRIGIGFA